MIVSSNIIKRISLVILFFSLSQFGIAQVMKHSAGLQLGTYYLDQSNKRISPAGGAFYDYQINNRFGLSTGAYYRQSYYKGFFFLFFTEDAPDPAFSKVTLHFLEIPLHLSINLNKKETAAWKTNLLAGMISSYCFALGQRVEYTGERNSRFFSFNSKNIATFASAGVEVSHSFRERYKLAFNPGLRVGLFDQYPSGDIYFMLKIGRIF